MRRALTFSITTVAAATAWVVGAGPALAYPPDPPPASTAQTQLASLTVRAEGSSTGDSRDKFPHWHRWARSASSRLGRELGREVALPSEGVRGPHRRTRSAR